MRYAIATNADPYNLFEFSRLSNAAVRVAQARRLWMQGQTNAPITIACHDNSNASSPDDFPNGPRGAIIISDYNGDAVTLGKHEFEGALAALATGGAAAVAYRAYLDDVRVRDLGSQRSAARASGSRRMVGLHEPRHLYGCPGALTAAS